MTDHANELRRHARKIPHPQGETPGVMLRAADEIERLRSESSRLQKEADKFEDGIDWVQRALQAEAKVEEMRGRLPCQDISKWPNYGAQSAPSVPTESIGKMLAQVMEAAVANGANSVSMPDEMVEVAAWLSGVQPNPANGQTRAVRDVIAERRRQIEVEGWAPEHDDRHGAHELAEAAACYCLSSAGKPFDYFETMWPWERWWFKVSGPRRDLVKAGALVLAEIERLDRAAAQKPEGE